jgi:hypothetical protein
MNGISKQNNYFPPDINILSALMAALRISRADGHNAGFSRLEQQRDGDGQGWPKPSPLAALVTLGLSRGDDKGTILATIVFAERRGVSLRMLNPISRREAPD